MEIVPAAGEKTISLELTDLLSGKTFPFTLDVAAGTGTVPCTDGTVVNGVCTCTLPKVPNSTNDGCIDPPAATCANGTEVNGACTCPDDNKFLNSTGDDCETCPGNKVAIGSTATTCGCRSGEVEVGNDTCVQPTIEPLTTGTLPANGGTVQFRVLAAGQPITPAPTVNVSVTPAGAATIAYSPATLDANGEAGITITPAAASAGTTITLTIEETGGAFSLTLPVSIAAVQPPGPGACQGGQQLQNDGTCKCPADKPDFVNNQCVAACEGGQQRQNDGSCKCPADKPDFVNNQCVAACVGGQQRQNDGSCKCPADKPDFVNNQCVAACEGGQQRQNDGSCKCPADKPDFVNNQCVAASAPTPDAAVLVNIGGDTSATELQSGTANNVRFRLTSTSGAVSSRKVSVAAPSGTTVDPTVVQLDTSGTGSFSITPASATAGTTITLTLTAADSEGNFTVPFKLDVAAADECAGKSTDVTISGSGAATGDVKCAFLNAHNQARKADNPALADLTWDERLATQSYNYASKCVWGHSTDTGNTYDYPPAYSWGAPGYGENLWATSESSTRVPEAFNNSDNKGWMDEKQWYNYATGTCAAGQMCGHYTQIVWGDNSALAASGVGPTEKVGCGYAYCQSGLQNNSGMRFYVVCQYAAPGNWCKEGHYEGTRYVCDTSYNPY